MKPGRGHSSGREWGGLERCWLWAAVALAALGLMTSCGQKKTAGKPPSLPPGQTPGELLRRGVEPLIRVLLHQSFQELTLEGSSLGPHLLIRVEGGQIVLSNPSGQLLRKGSGFRLEAAPRQLLRLQGKSYRGALEVFINPLGKPVVVNEVSLEEYLRGVIPGELGPDAFPELEALKAQSVAARTYGVAHLGEHVKEGFDVYSDYRSQLYQGAQVEHPLSDRAVESTRGVLAVFQERPILAMYSSTCGGLTEAFDAVFQGNPIPYLKGGAECPDRRSRYHQWKEVLSGEELQKRLRPYAAVGVPRQIRSLRRSSHGRTVELLVEGSEGKKILRGSEVRFALGLRSNWITGLALRHDRRGNIRQLTITGRGWGHGVGLCQIGAVELAGRGWSYQQILRHYYSGIDLQRPY